MTNYETLKATNNLTVWIIFIVVLAPAAAYTTFSIVKKFGQGICKNINDFLFNVIGSRFA